MRQPNPRTAEALENAPRIVVATVTLMEELAALLLAEVDIVTKRKLDEHPALLKRKQRLAVDYRANMKSFSDHPEILKDLDEDAKDILRTTSKKLAKATDDNARMLRAAIDATRGLIQNIIAMIKCEAMPEKTYKNHARSHLSLGSYSPKCAPIAVSRSV